MGFASASPRSGTSEPGAGGGFLEEYVSLVLAGRDKGEIGAWLMRNAKRMDKAMFDSSNWQKLKPFDVLALRACAPARVFTPSAMDKYLHNVSKRTDLTNIAEATFTEGDLEFITKVKLPEDQEELRPVIKGLMRLAYDYGIRSADPRVK